MARPKLFRSVWFMIPGSLFVGVVLAELVLRFLLFNDSGLAQRLGTGLRDAGNFADADSDDDYWKLRVLFLPPERREACTGFDAQLGWTNIFIEPETLQHLRRCPPDERQLVLLYGDSFAACLTAESDCFAAIMHRTELGQRYCMLDYGVGGYGLDQVYLMVKRSIDMYADRKPFVIVGVLAENALERTVLSFREWPKPRFRVVDGKLELGAPLRDGFEGYMADHPLQIRSYLVRYLAYRSRLLPKFVRERLKGKRDDLVEKQALARHLLTGIEHELTSRGIEHAYLLFHARGALTPPNWAPWQERLIRDVCQELGARLISTRPYLLAANDGVPHEPSRFYMQTGRSVGHLTAVGNAIVFEAMCDALEGNPEPTSSSDTLESLAQRGFRGLRRHELRQSVMGHSARVVTDREHAPIRASQSRVPPFDRWEDSARECVATGVVEPTRVEIELGGSARRFRASARAAVYPAAADAVGTVLLLVETDGQVRFREELAVDGEPHSLDVDLTGVQRLVIVSAPVSSTPPDAWVCLSDPEFE